MNIDAYLKRLNYQGQLAPTPQTLRDLHVTHLQQVPFENLSIHSGEPIVLNDEALFTKIVTHRRGGFCYELNGLFAALLRGLGFEVAMLSAGVARPQGGFSPDFDHMTLMVTPPNSERWLADVGFGESFVEPLRLDERAEQAEGTQSFRIVTENGHLILMNRKHGEEWTAQYRFTLQPYSYADYEEMCHFHQTSPDSHFTKARLCSLATPDGRITLSDMRLITTSAKHRDERLIATAEEYARVLRDEFGIVMKN
ncbi:MAG TPA: arylamine N-acetyltransferase [Pyrinomonadaceae bacterium]|nr:arylamine N-acetyltransferase [Pyrinomonadaceae bacterium]